MVTPKDRSSTTPPLVPPHGLGPATRRERLRGLQTIVYAGKNVDYGIPAATQHGGGQIEQSRSGTERPFIALILFFACLFPGPLARQRGLYTLFLAGLQVEGVTLDLLDNVFLLHLALEAA